MIKLTDDEIKKALECCSRLDGCCGEECPMLKMDWADVRLCSGLLRQEAINIINRKDTKIAELTEEINHQQAEIENLNIVLQAMRNAANSYKIENERYKGFIKLLEADVKTAKSEAIKEFADRLKAFVYYADGIKDAIVDETDINNLVQEMAGEADV